MKKLLENKYINRLIKLSLVLFIMFCLIAISSNFYTSVYVNNKQLELCNIARANDTFNSTVCFFDESYSYSKLSIDAAGEGASVVIEPVCKEEYTQEELEAEGLIDSDLDGIPDECDVCPGGENSTDEDQDGVPDECDVCPGGDDNIDTDGDGVPDECDVCPGGNDKQDADKDGVPNSCDVCFEADDLNDKDGNGIPDECEGIFNNPDNTFNSVEAKFDSIYDTRSSKWDEEQ